MIEIFDVIPLQSYYTIGRSNIDIDLKFCMLVEDNQLFSIYYGFLKI